MSYCASRGKDRRVCVCSELLCKIFLTSAHMCRVGESLYPLRSFFQSWFSLQAIVPVENLVLILSDQTPEITWSRKRSACWDAPPLGCSLVRICEQFSPLCIFPLWRRFLWSPQASPISALLHYFWNRISPFCTHSVLVAMDTSPKWLGLHMNLFISVIWSGLECAFFGAAKANIVFQLSTEIMTHHI